MKYFFRLTNIIHQLVGGKVVEDIVRRCILSNSVSLGFPKHLLLPLISKERRCEGQTSTKKARCSPLGTMATMTLLLLLLTSSFLLSLTGC